MAKFKRMFLHKRRALRKAFYVAVKVTGSNGLAFEEFCDLIRKYDPSLTRKQTLLAFEFLDRVNLDNVSPPWRDIGRVSLLTAMRFPMMLWFSLHNHLRQPTSRCALYSASDDNPRPCRAAHATR